MTDRERYEAWASSMIKQDRDARSFDYPVWEAWQEAIKQEREAGLQVYEALQAADKALRSIERATKDAPFSWRAAPKLRERIDDALRARSSAPTLEK